MSDTTEMIIHHIAYIDEALDQTNNQKNNGEIMAQLLRAKSTALLALVNTEKMSK